MATPPWLEVIYTRARWSTLFSSALFPPSLGAQRGRSSPRGAPAPHRRQDGGVQHKQAGMLSATHPGSFPSPGSRGRVCWSEYTSPPAPVRAEQLKSTEWTQHTTASSHLWPEVDLFYTPTIQSQSRLLAKSPSKVYHSAEREGMVELLPRNSSNSPLGKQMDKHHQYTLTPHSLKQPLSFQTDALKLPPDQRITAARTEEEQGKANGCAGRKGRVTF